MRFFDYIKVALKNLQRRKSRTFLTIFAIVIGAVSVVIMLSLVIGAKRVLVSQLESIGGLTLITVNSSPDMQGGGDLFSPGNSDNSEGKKIDDKVVSDLKKMNHVADATPTASVWAKSMKLEGQDKKTWPNIIGYDVGSNVFEVPIVAGRGLEKGDMDKIVVGMDTLKTFRIDSNPRDAIGKDIILLMDGSMTPDWGPEPPKPPENGDNKSWWDEQSKKQKEIKVTIVGVTRSGMGGSQNYISLDFARRMQTQVRWEFDESSKEKCKEGPCPMSNTQKLVKEDMLAKNGYGAVMLKADNTKNVKNVGEEIKKLGFGVTTAQDMLDQISKIFTAIGLLTGAIGGISLFVAALGIINTMIMATYERTREIGVMRACGSTKATIRRLFTFEAAMIGFFGGLVGLFISYLLSLVGNFVADKIATSQSVPISGIIQFPLWLIFGVIGFTTLIGMFAGLYPAHRAAKLDPVEALRYE